MKPVSGKELARAPKRHGWTLLRIHGRFCVEGRGRNWQSYKIPKEGRANGMENDE